MIFLRPVFQSTKKRLSFGIFPLVALFALTLTSCTIGSYPGGTFQKLTSQALSLNDPNFRTCVFDPPYSIVHFPMYHFPSKGHYTSQVYEKVVHSQFQLFHTIIDYNRSPWDLSIFDENFTTDTYNPAYFYSLTVDAEALMTINTCNPAPIQSLMADEKTPDKYKYKRIDNVTFDLRKLRNQAECLFRSGLPRYYELLNSYQKNFFFNIGASFTLYLLGEIPKIHKVISPNRFLLAKEALSDSSGQLNLQGDPYWIYTFREEELKKEVLKFYNPQKILFIAYGASHDFLKQFKNYPFQSGHKFCLGWTENLGNSQNLLP